MQNHRSNNPIKCLYCSFSSTGEAAIQRHMAEHHDQSEIPIAMRKQFPQTSEMDTESQDEGLFAACSCSMLCSVNMCLCFSHLALEDFRCLGMLK